MDDQNNKLDASRSIYSENITEGRQKDVKTQLYRKNLDQERLGIKTELVDLDYHTYLDDLREGREIIGTSGQSGNYSSLYLSLLEGRGGLDCSDKKDLHEEYGKDIPVADYGCNVNPPEEIDRTEDPAAQTKNNDCGCQKST